MISGISFLLGISNHNYLDNYLVSKLFKSNSVVLVASQADSMKEYCLFKCLPTKVHFCFRKSKTFAMEQARLTLAKEVDIIKLIRSRRFMHMALKHLLDPTLIKELKSQSLFKHIDIKPIDSSAVD